MFCLLADADAGTWRAWLGYKNTTDGKDYKAAKRNAEAYLSAFQGCKDQITESAMRAYVVGAVKLKGVGARTVVERARRYFEIKQDYIGLLNDANKLIEALFDIRRWSIPESEEYATATIDMTSVRLKALDILQEVNEGDKAPTNPIEQLRLVARSLRYDIAVREPYTGENDIDIQVTTLWSAKGVTAHHVYVIGLTEESIPGSRRDEYPGTDADHRDEQRRLFYVSMTRSKNTLVLSRPQRIKSVEAKQLGLDDNPVGPNGASATAFWTNLTMCPFLRDIINYLPTVVSGEKWAGCDPK